MAKSPLVSVILPARNCGPYLKEAVDSVLTQTFENFEILVIDDGSDDGSIETLGRDDHRLKVIVNPGCGLVDALNAGCKAASGQYLARMDGDDICHPSRLELQVDFLHNNPRIGVTATQVEVIGDGGPAEGYRLYEAWINSVLTPADIRREIYIESPLPHPTVMMRAEVFQKLGGYRDMGWPEDYDLWLRANEAGVSMGKVGRKLLKWRDSDSRLSKKDERYSRKNFMRVKAHFLARAMAKKTRPIIWGAGKTGGLLARLLNHEGAEISGFIDINRRKIGRVKAGKPVFGPDKARQIDDALILVAVASRGARDTIRDFLNDCGKVEGIDYYCVV
ncbi:Glycosyl transferase, group 2 family [hydrothermal vent metagenome]|uniref:Glycosyl transferase, group 2 family n=1 Tax=hydrothermal vent metagenome TaxID=652676 RepID=A0A3B1B9J8_9ZZZZ